MHSSATAISCALDIGPKTVELLVLHGEPTWRWEVRFVGGQILDAGVATTKLAAQVSAQQAFEYRLKRSGLALRQFAGYHWNDVVIQPQSVELVRQ